MYSVHFSTLLMVTTTLTKVEAIGQTCLLKNALLYDDTCIQCIQHSDIVHNLDCFGDQRGQHVSIQSKRNFNKMSTSTCCLENIRYLRIIKIRQASQLLNQKRNLKVVTIVRPPFSKISKLNGEVYEGVIFELLQAIQTKYNFSMTAFLPYDGNWGAKVNGTWNGMIGQVIRKEMDCGAAPFSVTLDRSRVIDFTMAFHQEPSSILIPPPTAGEKFTVLIRPLSKQVWASVLVTVFILIPSLYCFYRVNHFILNDKHRVSVGDIIWFLIGSLLQQDTKKIPQELYSNRLFMGIWWAMTLVIATIYIAFLVSYLSSPKLYNLVDSLEALTSQKKIKWTFRTNTAHRSLFKSDSSTGTYKLIGARASESDLVRTDLDGVEHVLRGKFAFIKEKSFLDVAIANDFERVKKCRMTLAKQEFFTVGIALVLEKKSPITTLFNFEISSALATGIMDYWKRAHWPNRRLLVCTDAASYIIETQPKARKLKLDDLQGAYFLLVCGLILSILSFVLEHFNTKASDNFRKFKLHRKLTRIWKFLR